MKRLTKGKETLLNPADKRVPLNLMVNSQTLEKLSFLVSEIQIFTTDLSKSKQKEFLGSAESFIVDFLINQAFDFCQSMNVFEEGLGGSTAPQHGREPDSDEGDRRSPL